MGNTEVLVVSNDEGWVNFASKSSRIHAGPKLSDLLVALQVADPNLLKKALAAIKGAEADKILSGLDEQIGGMAINADVQSYHYADAEVTDSRVLSVDLNNLDEHDLEIVRSDEDEFVIRWTISALVRFNANVELSVFDSVDKDYMTLGIEDVSRDAHLELEALLTFSIVDDGKSVTLELDSLQLTDNGIDVDFGEVEISYDQDDR